MNDLLNYDIPSKSVLVGLGQVYAIAMHNPSCRARSSFLPTCAVFSFEFPINAFNVGFLTRAQIAPQEATRCIPSLKVPTFPPFQVTEPWVLVHPGTRLQGKQLYCLSVTFWFT